MKKLKTLLKNGAAVNHQGNDGFFALIIAVVSDHTNIVKVLLDNEARVDLQTMDGKSSLMIASKAGQSEIVGMLIESCGLEYLETEQCEAALWSAVKCGHSEIVRMLLNNAAPVNLLHNGLSILMLACHLGHCEVVKVLLEHDADVNVVTDDNWTVLMIASQKGCGEIIELLIREGAKLNLQNKEGWSALMIASHSGHKEIVEILLQSRAKVNLRKRDGLSALILASGIGNKDIVQLLLNSQAKVNLKTEGLTTSALILASQNGHADVVELLLKNNAKYDELVEGNSGLMVVLENECSGILRQLQGSNNLEENLVPTDVSPSYIQGNRFHYPMTVQLNNTQRQLSLHNPCPAAIVVAHQGHDKVIEVLENNGAVTPPPPPPSPELFDFTIGSTVGNIQRQALKLQLLTGETSALMLASCHGHYEVVKKLLDGGAQVNLQTRDGCSALMGASQNGHSRIVEALLQHSADVNMTNNNNCSAISFAQEAKKYHVMYFFGTLQTLANTVQPTTDPHTVNFSTRGTLNNIDSEIKIRSLIPAAQTSPQSSISDAPSPMHQNQEVHDLLNNLPTSSNLESLQVFSNKNQIFPPGNSKPEPSRLKPSKKSALSSLISSALKASKNSVLHFIMCSAIAALIAIVAMLCLRNIGNESHLFTTAPENSRNIMDSSPSMNSKPTLLQMVVKWPNNSFDVSIVEEVALYCKKLGYILGLNEKIVFNMWNSSPPSQLLDTCERTIKKWLEGQGKTPVTWETFIKALEELSLSELSRKLRQIIAS